MKIPKKALLVTALVLLAGGGTAMALVPESTPTKAATVSKPAAKVAAVESASAVSTQPTPVAAPSPEPITPQPNQCAITLQQQLDAETARYQAESTKLNTKYESFAVSVSRSIEDVKANGTYEGEMSQVEQKHKGAIARIQAQYGC